MSDHAYHENPFKQDDFGKTFDDPKFHDIFGTKPSKEEDDRVNLAELKLFINEAIDIAIEKHSHRMLKKIERQLHHILKNTQKE